MNFVSGLSLPSQTQRDTQPLELVEEILKNLISLNNEAPLSELLQDSFISTSKRMRAKLCIETARCMNLRPKDVGYWGAAMEIIHNAFRVQESAHFDFLSRDNCTHDETKSYLEANIASSAFLALLPAAILQAPLNDGLRTKLIGLVSEYLARMAQGYSYFLSLPTPLSMATLPDDFSKFVFRRSSLFYELPVQGTALAAGLSLKESVRMAEPFRELGILQFLIDDLLVILENSSRLNSDHSLSHFNFVMLEYYQMLPHKFSEFKIKWQNLFANKEGAKEELNSLLIESGVLAAYVQKIRMQHMNIEKNDLLKPWPKMLEMYRSFAQTMLRSADYFLKTY